MSKSILVFALLLGTGTGCIASSRTLDSMPQSRIEDVNERNHEWTNRIVLVDSTILYPLSFKISADSIMATRLSPGNVLVREVYARSEVGSIESRSAKSGIFQGVVVGYVTGSLLGALLGASVGDSSSGKKFNAARVGIGVGGTLGIVLGVFAGKQRGGKKTFIVTESERQVR